MGPREFRGSISDSGNVPSRDDGRIVPLVDWGRTLEALYNLVSTDGGVAILSRGVPLPLPSMTAWRVAACRVVRQYLGEIPLPWDHEPPPPEEIHEAYLKRSRFKDVIEHREFFEVEWTVESIIGNLYSTRSAIVNVSVTAHSYSSVTYAAQSWRSSPTGFVVANPSSSKR